MGVEVQHRFATPQYCMHSQEKAYVAQKGSYIAQWQLPSEALRQSVEHLLTVLSKGQIRAPV